jgi:hypothetical protein
MKIPGAVRRKRYKSKDLYGERSAGKTSVAPSAEVVVRSSGSEGGHGCKDRQKIPASARPSPRLQIGAGQSGPLKSGVRIAPEHDGRRSGKNGARLRLKDFKLSVETRAYKRYPHSTNTDAWQIVPDRNVTSAETEPSFWRRLGATHSRPKECRNLRIRALHSSRQFLPYLYRLRPIT